jgi:DNA-binding response OmpR family regulator
MAWRDPERLHALILVVEDDPAVARAIQAILRIEEMDVELCRRGADAIRLAHRRYDAAIIDYGLPDMNGIGVAKEIRREDPKMPIVFISGYVGIEEAVERRLQGGLWYTLEKPWDPKALVTVLRTALGSSPRDGHS